MVNAVCCSDDQHCCPANTVCNLPRCDPAKGKALQTAFIGMVMLQKPMKH